MKTKYASCPYCLKDISGDQHFCCGETHGFLTKGDAMSDVKANTSIRVAIFNSFENRGKLTTAEEVDSLVDHVRDAISQRFTVAMMKSHGYKITKAIMEAPLEKLNEQLEQIISDSLKDLFKELVK